MIGDSRKSGVSTFEEHIFWYLTNAFPMTIDMIYFSCRNLLLVSLV